MQWYRNAPVKAFNKEIDWDTDDLRLTLHTATYAPNLDLHDYVDDLTNELATGGGYTAGGLAVTKPAGANAYTAANSWGQAWAASTAYDLGRVIKPVTGNGRLYRAAVAGTSAATEPTWPTTVGLTVVDGGVTWECVGSGIVVLKLDDAVWASPTTFGPFRYAVLSDRTPATAATQPLLGLSDFTTDRTAGGGSSTIDFSDQGVLQLFVP